VRNVTTILTVLGAELDRQAAATAATSSPSRGQIPLPAFDADDDRGRPGIQLGEKHRLWRLRLAPLKGVQRELEERLGASSVETLPPGVDDDDDDPHTAAAALALSGGGSEGGVTTRAYAAKMPTSDFFVRGTHGWKSALDKIGRAKKGGSVSTLEPGGERDGVTEMLVTCRDDIKALWADGGVRQLLKRREVRMDDAPGL
jgi:hypothetical protein